MTESATGLSTRTEAALLLTVPLRGSRVGDAASPLTPTEWARLGGWLHSIHLAPDALLMGQAEIVDEMNDPGITAARVERLLARGPAFGLALEKWQRAGLWAIETADEAYPARLRERLGNVAPPVLFGAGDRRLLQSEGVAIVGSRAAGPDDLEEAAAIGVRVARQGFTVISGTARGVDQAGMSGALDRDGAVIGIPSFGLLSDATSQHYRDSLMDTNLVLVSPFNPEARFDVGNAMGRNKLIYAMSAAAIVVVTEADRGGTWAGATECLRRKWVPVWVRGNGESGGGNAALVACGGQWLPEDFDVRELAMPPELPSLLGEQPGAYSAGVLDTYEQFMERLRVFLAEGQKGSNEIKAAVSVADRQLKLWLARAVDEGSIEKVARPARYQLPQVKLL